MKKPIKHEGNICCQGCFRLGEKAGKSKRDAEIIEKIENKIKFYKKLKYNQKGYPKGRFVIQDFQELIKQIEKEK